MWHLILAFLIFGWPGLLAVLLFSDCDHHH